MSRSQMQNQMTEGQGIFTFSDGAGQTSLTNCTEEEVVPR
jgi:hypothetical protein